MEILSNLQIIIGIIATLTTGGVIGTISAWKYQKRKNEAQTQGEENAAIASELTNANQIIQLYKTALEDLKALTHQNEEAYTSKIKILETKQDEALKQLDEYRASLRDYEKKVEELTKVQLKLKLEVMTVRSQSNSNCEVCEFRDGCQKYKAKLNHIKEYKEDNHE